MTPMETEIWANIPGYESLYQVSNFGRVRGIKRNRILSSPLNNKGYARVNLCKDGKYKTMAVHRLVLMSFTDESEWGEEVNHIDYVRSNNRLDNLEWVTRLENVRYSIPNKPAHYVQKVFKPIKNFTKVVQETLSGELIKVWENLSTIYRETGFEQTPIKKCCEGRPHCKTAYGYKWRYN